MHYRFGNEIGFLGSAKMELDYRKDARKDKVLSFLGWVALALALVVVLSFNGIV